MTDDAVPGPDGVPIGLDDLVPGGLVRHPTQPDWGVGQVQSAIGDHVTVSFAEAGKVVINRRVIALVPVTDDAAARDHPALA